MNSRVFAIGLGTADQLNPGALSDIAAGTGGFLLLTGNPGIDDQLLLQKYFAQVLAGATNAAIIVDPDGFVPAGGRAVVPFDLTAADIRADVLLLGQMAPVVHVELIAPDGTTITAGAGAEEAIGEAYRVLRVVPADVVGAAAGQWQAVLSVDDGELDRWIRRLREQLTKINPDTAGQILDRILSGIKAHGVPYSVTVQARSALRLGVTLSQQSRLPGTSARLRAVLTDSGIPLDSSAAVNVFLTSPNGTMQAIAAIPAREPGVYSAELATTGPGVYRVLVRARGRDLRGTRFTREELRTLAVWARGDDAPPLVIDPGSQGAGGTIDVCGLLTCLLGDDRVRRLLTRNELDPDRLAECVKAACG